MHDPMVNWTGFDEGFLVREMLAGKDEAFESFFHAYFPPLYRFALARLNGNEDAAEEVAQFAVSKAILKLETYRGEATVFSWLRTFCRHEIFAWYERHQMDSLHQTIETEAPSADPALLIAKDDLRHPEGALRSRDLARQVQEALDCLPEHYGNVLEWKYLDGRTVKEIAVRLQLTEKAVESLLSRARQAFRIALQDLGIDPTAVAKGD